MTSNPPAASPSGADVRAGSTAAAVARGDDLVPCAACGAPVDALRAGHVAIFDAEFCFFCDYYRCRRAFVSGEPVVTASSVRPGALAPEVPRVALASPGPAAALTVSAPPVPARLQSEEDGEWVEPLPGIASPSASPDVAPGSAAAEGSHPGGDDPAVLPAANPVPGMAQQHRDRRDMGTLLVGLALVAGVLTCALELAVVRPLIGYARLTLVGVGAGALLGRALTEPRDPMRPHWLVVVVATFYAALVAAWAQFAGLEAPGPSRAAFLAGTILTVTALGEWIVTRATQDLQGQRDVWLGALEVASRRVVGEVTALAHKEYAFDVAPGEDVLVDTGETVAVDFVVSEGTARIRPWPGAATTARRREGEIVLAGAHVLEGTLRGRCVAAGEARAFARPLVMPEARVEVEGTLPRRTRRLSERGAPLLALAAGGLAALLGRDALGVALVVVAVYAAFANAAAGTLVAAAVARGAQEAMRRGILYASAAAWDACTRVTAAVFCVRGTLLRGEPELIEAELTSDRPGGHRDADDLLALAAGLATGGDTPSAYAIRRAAEERGLRPAAVRNLRDEATPDTVWGVGVEGEVVGLGPRTSMIDRHVSVAVAERRVAELETAGRSVLMVSRGGRLEGLVALQDGLRPGARAAVQHLLDVQVEPVLMSADTRETCAALGRALDVDHLRAEVSPAARADEIGRLRALGGVVAVLGHRPFDDAALEAADVAVVLHRAAKSDRGGAAAVEIISDDPRAAALSLALARRTRAVAGAVGGMLLAPAAFAAIVVAAGILPPEFAPLAHLVGALAALAQSCVTMAHPALRRHGGGP
ncbi:MAG: HAD family hydrolase [Myxococcota bacterium]